MVSLGEILNMMLFWPLAFGSGPSYCTGHKDGGSDRAGPAASCSQAAINQVNFQPPWASEASSYGH